ncbi:MAG TPA: hypothetical protein VF221_20705 [Chloroflexota bacterium]
MHIALHPVTMAGLALIAIGLVIYLGAMLAAILRVRRQYSSAMADMGRLRVGAALAAAARLWPVLLLIAIGVGIVVVGR